LLGTHPGVRAVLAWSDRFQSECRGGLAAIAARMLSADRVAKHCNDTV
jgi:hypothetical protein